MEKKFWWIIFSSLLFILITIFVLRYFSFKVRSNSESKTVATTSTQSVNQPQRPPEEKINPEKFYFPILLYHHIVKLKNQSSYYVSPEIFESQMKWLKDNDYHVVSYDKFYQAAIGKGTLPSKPVVITFDDGLKDQYTDGFPILKKFGYTATFFIKLNNFNKGGLNTQMAKEMIQEGMTIGSHSVNHDNMAQMDSTTLNSELIDSKKYLEKTLGVEIKYFSYPGGAFSSKTIIATKNAGYLSAVTTKHRAYQEIKTPDSLFQVSRIHIDDEMPTFIDWVQGKNLY